MKDYTKMLPPHRETLVGENDLFLEIYETEKQSEISLKRPSLLFVHGAYTGSWMWSKYISHFYDAGWKCYVMNLRSHYKSRVMDMTRITFEDYLEDIKEVISEVIAECGEAPIVIGFSLGGILCQKLAETVAFAGLVVIDSCICKEVHEKVPYESRSEDTYEIVVPAPLRNEVSSVDESENDVAFQRKYLSMESSVAFRACANWFQGNEGVTVDADLITCPILVVRAINNERDERRGRAEAEHLRAEYTGYWNTTHTGLLIGQRYQEIVDRMKEWMKRYV